MPMIALPVISPDGMISADALPAAAVSCQLNGQTVGYFLDSTSRCITDVARLTEQFLQSDAVMILYIDGLGWDLFRRSDLPFIKYRFSCECAQTTFPPVTHSTMASMMTGEHPDRHGIISRRCHSVGVPSLLRHEESLLIEADEELIRLEKPAVLTLPEANETKDHAVLTAALQQLNAHPRLIIVHFHGLDDLEHDHGDDLSFLTDKLYELDTACAELCSHFKGTVILCADHGVHSENGTGHHGDFDYRDMYIPLGVAHFEGLDR